MFADPFPIYTIYKSFKSADERSQKLFNLFNFSFAEVQALLNVLTLSSVSVHRYGILSVHRSAAWRGLR